MRAAGWFAAVALGSLTASQQPALRVLRVNPSPRVAGEPTSVVTVAFDRPVAGQLDGTVAPESIFSIAPPVAGKVEWRDPITLRFTPAAPLTAGGMYVVTIANTFQAMDGSRLDQPYRFGFRVGGPRVLSVRPVGTSTDARFLPQDVQFEMVVSAPADLAVTARMVYLQLRNTCNAPALVRLNPVTQRPIPQDTSRLGRLRAMRRYGTAGTDLARVIRLVPEQTLPRACAGTLLYPERLELASTAQARRLDFATYGPFRLNRVTCGYSWRYCPTGLAILEFSTPVKGADVVRAVSASPAVSIGVGDTSDEAATWELDAKLKPRTAYTFTLDSTLQDVFGQRLTGQLVDTLTTTGFMPMLDYPTGAMVVERQSYRTIAVKHVNVDTLFVTQAPVPESLLTRVLAAPQWNLVDLWPLLAPGATTRAILVPGPADAPLVSAVRMPAYNAALRGSPTLTAVRVSGYRRDTTYERRSQIALVQVTDLGVAVKLGAEEAVVWVTTMHDGRPCAGASVVLFDRQGHTRAGGATDARGMVRFTGLAPDTAGGPRESRYVYGFEGYVTATLGSDRAIVPLSTYSWELSPWQFNVSGAGPADRLPAAAAVFTERGIYRPGEAVHAKAIVRAGALGALRVPGRSDSLHWVFSDREEGKIRDTTVALSAFGTADQTLKVPADLPLGTYRVGVGLKRGGKWVELASAAYRVAEYRPPEFLVSVASDTAPLFAGDSLSATVEARYLFGAPMARAAVTWTARRTPVPGWALDVPGAEAYTLGETGWWWEDEGGSSGTDVTGGRTDTLDATGHLVLRVPAGTPAKGKAARVTLEATVTDVNRQTVSASTSAIVHPAAFYIGAKALGDEYFWRAGQPESVAVIAVQPGGRRVAGVAVRGTVVRREWHRVLRARAGLNEQVGEWVADTVARCDLTTAQEDVLCRFTPQQGGSYVVGFKAKDAAGRDASTSFFRWATGKGWVPWSDESQFKMDVIPDKTRYEVGDTATVLFASPFTDAEAWITVEREGIIEQRRLRLTSGATSLKFALTEAYVPNAYVGIVVARGRSAAPGSIGDPGRPALRVGYAELNVTPRVKRLKVDVQAAAEYRPGDTARVELHVRDAAGAGARSEVTLWAVDEGVLALTGYKTPDPISLIYQPRGLGMRLGSDLISVATQVLDSEGVSIKGDRAPGGGGGLEGGEVLRSRFSSTAFFLGSVVTDANGDAVASAKLPDNLTTFRVMAVAVTAGDRYGSGQSSLLVTRPLLARPALPRFLRKDDHFIAGVVVNQRAGGTPTVRVLARGLGVTLSDSAARMVTLAAGRGTEVRFNFRDTTTDTAVFRFDVAGAADSDAVLSRLPVRPAYFPRSHTVAGAVRSSDTLAFTLPGDIDPDRSRLVFGVGATPLSVIGGMYRQLAVYPYDCTEQVADELLPLVALYRAGNAPDGRRYAPADAQRQIQEGVATLSRRQRTDGGMGLWSAEDWTTPWLSAFAGEALLAARSAGVAVNDSVLARLAQYLYRSVHQRRPIFAPVADWFRVLQMRLAEDVAAVDFLSRFGTPDIAGENELLRVAPQLAWEDRVRLAQVLARRGAVDAGQRLLAPIWAEVRVEGRRAVIPDSALRRHYFWSSRRPIARLLSATLAVDSASALIGPLVETLVEQGRGATRWWWNTQDYGAAVEALAEFAARQRRASTRGFAVTSGGRQLLRSRGAGGAGGAGGVTGELTAPLTGLLTDGAEGSKRLALVVTTPAAADSVPLFYYATVEEVPLQRPVTPDQQGIEVERWYEDYATGKPVIAVPEGSLVRVRLRIRIAAERRFLALSDPLPAGLEAVDLSLRTAGGLAGPGAARGGQAGEEESEESEPGGYLWGWYYGSWDSGWWSPFDHREMRDDRVAYFATYLWPGTYTASYVARATTPGVFIRPPAHAEEMYNASVQGRSDGGVFTVTPKSQ